MYLLIFLLIAAPTFPMIQIEEESEKRSKSDQTKTIQQITAETSNEKIVIKEYLKNADQIDANRLIQKINRDFDDWVRDPKVTPILAIDVSNDFVQRYRHPSVVQSTVSVEPQRERVESKEESVEMQQHRREEAEKIQKMLELNNEQNDYDSQEVISASLDELACLDADIKQIRLTHHGTSLPEETLERPNHSSLVRFDQEVTELKNEIKKTLAQAEKWKPSAGDWLTDFNNNIITTVKHVMPYLFPYSNSKYNWDVFPNLQQERANTRLVKAVSIKKAEKALSIVIKHDHKLQALKGINENVDRLLTYPSDLQLMIVASRLVNEIRRYNAELSGIEHYWEERLQNKLNTFYEQFLKSSSSEVVRRHSYTLNLSVEPREKLIKKLEAIVFELEKNCPIADFDLKKFESDISSGKIKISTEKIIELVKKRLLWERNCLKAKTLLENAKTEFAFVHECINLCALALDKNDRAIHKKVNNVAKYAVPLAIAGGSLNNVFTTAQREGEAESQRMQNFHPEIPKNTIGLDHAMHSLVKSSIQQQPKIQISGTESLLKSQYPVYHAHVSKQAFGLSKEVIHQRQEAFKTTLQNDSRVSFPEVTMLNASNELNLSSDDVQIIPGTDIQNQIVKENVALIAAFQKIIKTSEDPRIQSLVKQASHESKNALKASRGGDIIKATEHTNRATAYAYALYKTVNNNAAQGALIAVGTAAGIVIAAELAPIFAGEVIITLATPVMLDVAQYIVASGISGRQLTRDAFDHEQAKDYVNNLLGDQSRLDGDSATEQAQDIVEQKQKAKNPRPHEQRELAAAAVVSNGLPPSPPRHRNRNENSNHNKNRIKNTEKQLYSAMDELKGKFETKQGKHSIYAVKADQITALTESCGKEIAFISADHLHNEIEVWDKNGRHLGAIDPETKKFIKRAMADPQRNF